MDVSSDRCKTGFALTVLSLRRLAKCDRDEQQEELLFGVGMSRMDSAMRTFTAFEGATWASSVRQANPLTGDSGASSFTVAEDASSLMLCSSTFAERDVLSDRVVREPGVVSLIDFPVLDWVDDGLPVLDRVDDGQAT